MHLTGQHGTRPALPIVLGYLILYLAAARLEDAVAGAAGLSPWSPRPGLTLVLLLLLGLRYAPLPLAAELAASLLRPPGGRPGVGWLLLDAAVVALAWTATAGLLCGRLRFDPALRRPRDLGQLLLVAVAAAPLLAVLPRVALAVAAGLVPPASAPAALAAWWARDAAGVALTAPLLAALVVRRVCPPAPGEPRWRPARDRLETAAQALAVALPPLLGLWLPAAQRPPLLAACFAPLAWVALRRGLAGAAAAATATGLLLAGTLALRQPADAAGAVADLQSFLLVAAVAALWIGALADARGAGQAERGQLEAVLEATPDCVATVDRAGRLLYLNQAGRRLLGVGDREPLAGRRLGDLLPQLAARLAAQADLGPARWTGATTLLRGGRRVPLEHVAVAHPAADGHTQAVSAITRDVSGLRQLEGELASAAERLDEQRLHLTAVTAHMPVALLVARVDGTCLRAEGRALARLCARPEALEGASLFQALEIHDQLIGDFCLAATGSAVSSWATVGAAVLETHFRPVVGRNGKVKQVIGLLGDVTERVRAETAAADLQARVDAMQARIDSLDQGGTVQTLTAWLRHLEILEEELAEGSPVTTLAPVKQTLERVLEAGADLAELPVPPPAHDPPVVTPQGAADEQEAPVVDLVLTSEPSAPGGAGGHTPLPERDGDR